MTEPIKVEIPPEILVHIKKEPEKILKELIVFELYREKKITLRQATDILRVT